MAFLRSFDYGGIYKRTSKTASSRLRSGCSSCAVCSSSILIPSCYACHANKMHYVYIVLCADDSYYTGITHNIEKRLAEHNDGRFGGYTSTRRPVTLVWHESVPDEHQAFLLERQIKGWSRAKKAALIRGDFDQIHDLVRNERKERAAKRKASNSEA